ncbi:hypothetical protein HYH03_009401 [Edaphochlamys debaryana]|uniref:tRNA-dihydrouridine(47) synthase [NAD(P)(+)] n=1 Tax=Edaphochlamys debaryana TaxID=47281 RepID=A0A836BXE7_9CHLO|nr:hypothetical protein HYH03_009401 [Edaphochlamys debaryana]|eukprot:KAG2492460.1 hypothetical protein HYH03_009401 [Edaphochlamys debaryana]
MENLADRPFRRALAATVGGFDEACTEFIRLPNRSENPLGSVRGVSAWYDACELGGTPLGAQVMGSSGEMLALAARHLVQVKGAPRVDLNCGCPANTVTGNGAGSSLLRTPEALRALVAAMVGAVGGAAPVSVKLRAGYDDTALFEDNLLAAQEGGAAFITLHPRTRRQAYAGAADWALTRRAVELLRIPVVGNGDVVSVGRAQALLRETGCAGMMVGRGTVHDPLLFHRIRHSFTPGALAPPPDYPSLSSPSASPSSSPAAAAAGGGAGPGGVPAWPFNEPEAVEGFLRAYAAHFVPGLEPPEALGRLPPLGAAAAPGLRRPGPGAVGGAAGVEEVRSRNLGKLKKVTKYLFASSPELAAACEVLLRLSPAQAGGQELLEQLCAAVRRHWPRQGPTRLVLLDHMAKGGGVAVREVGDGGSGSERDEPGAGCGGCGGEAAAVAAEGAERARSGPAAKELVVA